MLITISLASCTFFTYVEWSNYNLHLKPLLQIYASLGIQVPDLLLIYFMGDAFYRLSKVAGNEYAVS